MDNGNEAFRQEVALFRFGVIQELGHREPGESGNGALVRELSGRRWKIPGSRRERVAAETIRGWHRLYREGGFEALKPRRRADRGRPRRMQAATAEALIAVKEADRGLTVRAAIARARADGLVPASVPLPISTVHRLFTREGLMEPPLAAAKDRRRFAHAWANDLWMGDVMHGPKAGDGRRSRKSYLIALIDDATRVVPHAAFAFSEDTAALLPTLNRAIASRGVPRKLYVDNGPGFRSRHLALVCAKLGIALLHAGAYDPAGKGKIERWFRTVRGQFLPTLREGDTASLEALNLKLRAWVEGEYHQTPHRGLEGMTPLDKWAAAADNIRLPGADLDDLFLAEAGRKVMKDRTAGLNARLYEVDAALVGRTVVLRHDPAAPATRPLQVVCDGRDAGSATPLDALANAHARRARTGEPQPGSSIAFRKFTGKGGGTPCA